MPPVGDSTPPMRMAPEADSTRPNAAVLDRAGSNRPLWLACLTIYVVLAVTAYLFEISEARGLASLMVFCTVMCLASVLVPITGPRGQRVFLLPGVGLATMLLLPPLTASLPVLLANAVYSSSRETVAARRISLLRGSWVFLATLLADIACRVHAQLGHPLTPSDYVVGSIFFCAIYIAGRRTDIAVLGRHEAGARVFAWFRLEAFALLAAAPLGILMRMAWSSAKLPGLCMAAALYGLIVLITHYGFEVAMLRNQVQAMEKISAVTWSQTSPRRVVEKFVQLSARIIPCDRIVLWLTDHSQTRLDVVARSPLTAASADRINRSVRFGEGLVGRVADHQQPMIVRDGAGDPRFTDAEEEQRDGSPFSVLLLPLVVAGETVGVAQFERDTPQSYSQRDISRVQPLASQAAATIANVRAHQDVYNQSVTDALTGLYNRRYMQSELADERRRAERYGHELSIVMLDVDGFKSYNDTYGHPQGDILLKQLAEILRQNVRGVDILGRYGGEEFIILMPETSKPEAYQTCERLRNAVAECIFPGQTGDKSTTVHKTISLGVATFPADGEDAQTLVAKADQALYRAKHAGRNRTIVAGSGSPTIMPSSDSVAA